MNNFVGAVKDGCEAVFGNFVDRRVERETLFMADGLDLLENPVVFKIAQWR